MPSFGGVVAGAASESRAGCLGSNVKVTMKKKSDMKKIYFPMHLLT